MSGGFAELLTIIELMLLVGAMVFIVVIKKDVLDPRLYVLYGIFHWLFVSQLYYVFDIDAYFGFEIYEAAVFSDFEVAAGAALVLASTVVFLLGYFVLSLQYARRKSWGLGAQADIVARIQAGFGVNIRCAAFAAFLFAALLVGAAEKNIISIPVSLLLPVGYLIPAASIFVVFGVFLHFLRRCRVSVLGLFLYFVPLAYMVAFTNVVLIYPLVVACALFGVLYLPAMSRGKISLLVLAAPVLVVCAMAVQLAGKIYRRVANVGVEINVTNFYSNESYAKSFESAMVTLDSFNTEAFAVLLESMRVYVNSENYLFGSSLLSTFPLFKLYGGEVFQSFGRVFALDILRVSPQSNTAMAVTPMAEMAVNFSYAGTFFFYFLLGVFSCLAYEKFKSSRSLASVAVYFVFLVWLFLQQRGDFLNGNMYSAYVLVGVYVMARMFGRKYKMKTIDAGGGSQSASKREVIV